MNDSDKKERALELAIDFCRAGNQYKDIDNVGIINIAKQFYNYMYVKDDKS